MVDVDGAEFVSIDPFDSVLKKHNTTLDYGLLGLIKLINLQQPRLFERVLFGYFTSTGLPSLFHYRHSLPPSSSIDLCKPSGDALVS